MHGPGGEHVPVGGASGPPVADAAHDGGALERAEVRVGEMEGGVAFDDGDLSIAQDAADVEIAVNQGELGVGAEGQRETDPGRDPFGRFDLDFDVGAGDDEAPDKAGDELAGWERLA